MLATELRFGSLFKTKLMKKTIFIITILILFSLTLNNSRKKEKLSDKINYSDSSKYYLSMVGNFYLYLKDSSLVENPEFYTEWNIDTAYFYENIHDYYDSLCYLKNY